MSVITTQRLREIISRCQTNRGADGSISIDADELTELVNVATTHLATNAEMQEEIDRLRLSADISVTGHQHWGLQLMDAIGKFVEQAATSAEPVSCQIVARMKDVPDCPVVHLWATTSEQASAARCRELAELLAAAESDNAALISYLVWEGDGNSNAECSICHASAPIVTQIKHLPSCMLSKPHPGTAILDELSRLRSIVEKLPKTADGVYLTKASHDHCYSATGIFCYPLRFDGLWFATLSEGGSEILVSDCYSTREAAKRAKEKQ